MIISISDNGRLDSSSDQHMTELYNVEIKPGENNNLIPKSNYQATVKILRAELDRLRGKQGDGKKDVMPLDLGIKSGLPDKNCTLICFWRSERSVLWPKGCIEKLSNQLLFLPFSFPNAEKTEY